jgi:hypothetical protein
MADHIIRPLPSQAGKLLDWPVYLFFRVCPILLAFSLAAGTANGPSTASFPSLKAKNLEGKILSLPEDFSGELNLLLFAFDRDQQADVNSWIAAMPDLLKGQTGISFYEIPTIAKPYKLMKFVIDRGMKSAFKDPEQRARTITLYVDRAAFEHAMRIDTEDRIALALVDKKGNVLWRETGLYYDIKGTDFKKALAKLRAPK